MPEFKIPLAGSYNTRVTATNALSSASGIVGLGVVGVMIVGASVQSTDKDQRFINCFTETVLNPYTGQRTLYCVKRPGFGALNTPASGNIGSAIMVWSGSGNGTDIITAFGATNSTIYNSTSSLGTITGKATRITETVVSTTPTLVVVSTDNTGWYYDAGVATMTKITDAQFPGNAGKTLAGYPAHMDGYTFQMDTEGNIWNSDLNSITSWTATGTIAATSYPDKGVGIIRQGDKLMAFGGDSVQFYQNAGNPTGSPLARIESMTMRIGCISADAIEQINDVVFWAGSSPKGGISIWRYADGPKRVSPPEIDAALVLAGPTNISLTSTTFYGRTFLIVNASSVTYVCCLDENFAWHEWTSTTKLWYKCAGVAAGSTQPTYAISEDSTSGKVYTMNPSSMVFQDDGSDYTMRVQTSLIGEPNRRTFWEEIEIMGDISSTSSPLTISFSDDDYGSYTVLATVDLSSARPRWQRAGSAYRRSWVLTHSTAVPVRIEAMAGRKTVGQG